MPLSFVNPGLLLGALTAALPVVIHFLSRRRVRKLPFSDLRFLREAQTYQSRSLGLRRWLLLLLRVLALLCIALAVARPHWGGLAPGGSSSRSVLFVIDASASMSTQQDEGTRFAEAVRLCRSMLGSLPDGSYAQVLLATTGARPLFADWLPVATVRRHSLLAAEVSDGGFDLSAVLREAARQVATAPGTPVEIVLLSDLQAEALTTDVHAAPAMPAGSGGDLVEAIRLLNAAGETTLLLRRIGEPVAGGGITAVGLPQRAVRPGETVVVTANVQTDRSDQVFRLELDGQRVAEAVAHGAAHRRTQVVFSLSVPAVGRHRGWIRKESDRFAADDARPFVFRVRGQLRVLLAHGADRDTGGGAGSGRGGWRYLEAALVPTAGEEASLFDLQIASGSELAAGDLRGFDVAVFVDPDPLGRQYLDGLQSWLREGGAAALLVGDATGASYLRETLLPALGLPARAEFRALNPEGSERLVITAPDHPVLAGLDGEALATLRDIDWRRYFAIDEGESQVLLALTSGAPLLIEGKLGAGRFILLPANLYLDGSDLAVSPMFLPLMQRLMAYLAWRQTAVENEGILVGEDPSLRLTGGHGSIERLADSGRLLVDPPGDQIRPQPGRLSWREGVPVLGAEASPRAGFFTFTVEPDTFGIVAAAVPPGESIIDLESVDSYRDRLAAAGLRRSGDLGGTIAAGFNRGLAGRELAPWLLLLAVAILALELYLGRGAEKVLRWAPAPDKV